MNVRGPYNYAVDSEKRVSSLAWPSLKVPPTMSEAGLHPRRSVTFYPENSAQQGCRRKTQQKIRISVLPVLFASYTFVLRFLVNPSALRRLFGFIANSCALSTSPSQLSGRAA